MHHLLVLIFALFAIASAVNEVEFKSWAQKYNKEYASQTEYLLRLSIYTYNVQLVKELNGNSTGAVFELNQFADLTPTEFARKYLGSVPPTEEEDKELLDLPSTTAPDTFSWITMGKTTPVKNQAQCGSCWAFSATENIESVWMIAKGITAGSFKPLAPQQIVDCDKMDGGCNGGWPHNAYRYVISAGGMDTEATYPYTARNGPCKFSLPNVETTISNFKYATTTRNEDEMKTAVATVAPLSICVDAQPWQFYRSGVMMKSQCSTSIDHCVQITGYNTAANPPYWIVRNSWGTGWGEQGFIRLQYGQNTCACAQEATTAVV